MTFKEYAYECEGCGGKTKRLRWNTDPVQPCEDCGGVVHETSLVLSRHRGVIDDQLEGGPRFFEHLGHEPVFIESKSQLRREMDARGLQHKYSHTADYYAKKRRLHDEEKRDTGRNVEY